MSIFFDDSELSKPAVQEIVPENERTLELFSDNAKRLLYLLIDEMSTEQRFELLDSAQQILVHPLGNSTTDEVKINVLQAIELAAKERTLEPLGNLIRDIIRY